MISKIHFHHYRKLKNIRATPHKVHKLEIKHD